MSIRFGTNPIGWSNDDMPELGGDTPLEQCLSEARQAGFEGMELGNKFPREPAALGRPLSRRTGSTSSPAGIRPSFSGARRRRRWSACARISIS